MIKPEKIVRDGKVALLLSPGFGAGWSTWAFDNDLREFILFDRRVVEAAEKRITSEQVEDLIKSLTECDHIYCGGWSQVEVRWIPVGTTFYINDYDGSESLRYPGDGSEDWVTA